MDISNLHRTARRRFPGLPISRLNVDGEHCLLMDGRVSVHKEVRDRQVRSERGIRTVEEVVYVVTKGPQGQWDLETVEAHPDPIKALTHAVRVLRAL
jgi:hypothetical protein